jgi:hypothetical protein
MKCNGMHKLLVEECCCSDIKQLVSYMDDAKRKVSVHRLIQCVHFGCSYLSGELCVNYLILSTTKW